ncbi:MAG: signal peptidase II [Microthrixaceae bacterium]
MGRTPSQRSPTATQHHRAAFATAAATAVAIDQVSKHWALAALRDGPIALVGSLRLNLTFNDGAAFSLGGGRTTLIALLAVAVSLVLLRVGMRAEERLWAIGLGLIFGGAVGNLVDRALRSGSGFLGGHVVDFIDLTWWPVFNLADTFLWIGVGVLAIASLRQPRPER